MMRTRVTRPDQVPDLPADPPEDSSVDRCYVCRALVDADDIACADHADLVDELWDLVAGPRDGLAFRAGIGTAAIDAIVQRIAGYIHGEYL